MRKVELYRSGNIVDYEQSVSYMKKRTLNIYNGNAAEFIWLLEHDNIYTAGTSAKERDLLVKDKFRVYQTGRGGQYTYHGPGQRIVYFMLNLKYYKQDVRYFINMIEKLIIASLRDLGIEAFTVDGRIGVWVRYNKTEKKIAAVGLRLSKWISYHGVSINITTDLNNYKAIVPCGIEEYGVTSLKELRFEISMEEFDKVLLENVKKIFQIKLDVISQL